MKNNTKGQLYVEYSVRLNLPGKNYDTKSKERLDIINDACQILTTKLRDMLEPHESINSEFKIQEAKMSVGDNMKRAL